MDMKFADEIEENTTNFPFYPQNEKTNMNKCTICFP